MSDDIFDGAAYQSPETLGYKAIGARLDNSPDGNGDGMFAWINGHVPLPLFNLAIRWKHGDAIANKYDIVHGYLRCDWDDEHGGTDEMVPCDPSDPGAFAATYQIGIGT